MRDVILDFGELTSFSKQLKQLAVELTDFDEGAENMARILDEPFPGESSLANQMKSVGDDWSFSRARIAAQLFVAALASDDIGSMWKEWDYSADSGGASRLGQ